MKLGDAGEARVRGYLFILGRALSSFLPKPVALDALKEIESHIRERVGETEPEPDERAALERVLDDLGSPQRVARAYSGEMAIEEAVATGRVAPTARALWHLATTTVLGFFATLGLFVGYTAGLSFLAVALAKPIFPNNTGLIVINGIPRALGFFTDVPEGAVVWGGYWLIPIALAVGLLVLVATQRGTMRFLGWWRDRSAARHSLPVMRGLGGGVGG